MSAPGSAPGSVADVLDLAREVAEDEVARSVFFVAHGTRLAGSDQRYRNRYVLVRVGDSFGACAFEEGELAPEVADLSGEPLAALLEHPAQPLRIAAADAALGAAAPHRDDPRAELRTLPTGTPDVRAIARDAAVAELLTVAPGARVALIGVVNPLVAAIRERGGEPLLADRNLQRTHWGDPVADDHRAVLAAADAVLATGMTLGNGSFDEILASCRERDVPLAVYAQSGSAVARAFLGAGLTALSAEHFPFSQFSADASPMYLYRGPA
ncbi:MULTISPECIES: Rossmann-like domain-containing protein [Tsukamurella]|uniref:Putative heavy-metal chelation domain-containing protein n=2 Tax=Tsukamurella TaxID=2060 RepID=A0A5C5S881_9ACTN|nr:MULTISPECIES: DUF364 domain-containing protein [Tsukamurella]NMD58138.1 hypothetical protein [Tsukamurella columbiensis]TWS30561.1 hypothetical protein FK530_01425 [Tsukamurella conjunctivitidis]